MNKQSGTDNPYLGPRTFGYEQRHLFFGRERETELLRIDKEKAIEKQKKEIADVIRSRVAVEKTVAEEEERIKDVRVTAEANRQAPGISWRVRKPVKVGIKAEPSAPPATT